MGQFGGTHETHDWCPAGHGWVHKRYRIDTPGGLICPYCYAEGRRIRVATESRISRSRRKYNSEWLASGPMVEYPPSWDVIVAPME